MDVKEKWCYVGWRIEKYPAVARILQVMAGNITLKADVSAI